MDPEDLEWTLETIRKLPFDDQYRVMEFAQGLYEPVPRDGMTRQQWAIYQVLKAAKGKVVVHDAIIAAASFKTDEPVSMDHISSVLWKLRQNLGENERILNAHGVGYRLVELGGETE